MTFTKTLLALALVAAASAASAQYRSIDAGPYVALEGGVSMQNGVDADTSDQGSTSAALGYSFGSGFGVEASFADFGSRQEMSRAGMLSWKSSATSVALVGARDVFENFGITAKLGVARTTADASLGGATEKVSGTGLLLGIGVQYRMDRNWTLRGGLDSYRDFVGSGETINVVSGGVQYRF